MFSSPTTLLWSLDYKKNRNKNHNNWPKDFIKIWIKYWIITTSFFCTFTSKSTFIPFVVPMSSPGLGWKMTQHLSLGGHWAATMEERGRRLVGRKRRFWCGKGWFVRKKIRDRKIWVKWWWWQVIWRSDRGGFGWMMKILVVESES